MDRWMLLVQLNLH